MDGHSSSVVGSSSVSSIPNPSSALPPKPIKSEQTSVVWEHFTKVEGGDLKDPKSQCKYCNKLFSCHTRKHGTNAMLGHLRNTCKKYPDRFDKDDKSQSKLSFEGKREGQMAVGEGSVGKLVITKYNAAKIREAIAQMIIKDELPFSFVEGEGFWDFMNIVEPRFSIYSRNTVMKDCVKLFLSEKEKFRAMFMTTGVRILLCMLEWGIRNIFAITVDNASTNDAALEFVKRRTSNKEGAILESQFMHIRCCAHILNLIVTDGLKEVDEFIVSVRSAVKYAKSSPVRFDKFKACIEREQLDFKGLLYLDIPTRWNSTFFMLEGAEKCQAAFQLMEELDKTFKPTLTEEKNEKNDLAPPTCADWSRIKIFLKFLKLFYDATIRILGSLYCTSNMYFQEICGIQMHLQEYIDNGDYVWSAMAEKMMTKYNKYWGHLENNDRVNLMMFIAVILDPQTKLVSLEYWFKDVLGVDRCNAMKKKLKSILHKLYDHYNSGESSSQVLHSSGLSQGFSMKIEESENANLYFMNRFHKYLTSKSDIENKSEVD
ncbi:zinc finger BED domain-containing protein RICESLEEPER 2-like [Corylus avellana]|uniref:zinc finger BED domain-containing protein RICESLEEPER 2-like n=1 Tax=Corylus avellana TaxID=13451 RepID=UPI00286CB6F6|nr:zinc finger BED domain-containing protein RICESLEEPER 2-like [Corylus avellana]